MAPVKRSRREVEDEDDIIAVESARSNFQQEAHRKKARVSAAGSSSKARRERSPSTASSDSDDGLVPEQEHATFMPMTQANYDDLRDNGLKHLDHEEEDDEREGAKMEIRLEEQHRRQDEMGENRAADNAIIEQIECVNFMCHENLTVKLGPLINFVVGQNGSGKSAVLTAVTLCLGGKASATNRGTSLKSLIKEGQDSARLTVTLKNEGVDAYKPDLYGNKIIIERHFNRSGATGFKLRSCTKGLVSSKKGDVDDLIEYYQLQVDNPMNVLTQDAAKSFIQSSTPAQKYRFFEEGVQLKQLDNDYRLIIGLCEDIEDTLENGKEAVRASKKKLDDAQVKVQMVQQYAGTRQQRRILGNQMAWAQVEEVEAILARQEQKLADAEERLAEAEQTATDKDTLYTRIDNQVETQQNDITALEQNLMPLREEEIEAKAAYDMASQEVRNSHAEERRIRGLMVEGQNKIKGYQTDIENETRRVEEANGDAPAQIHAEIKVAEAEVNTAIDALKQHEDLLPRINADIQGAEKAINDAKAPINAKHKDLENCQIQLDRLNNDRGDQMAAYPRNMSRLIQAIRQDSSFQEPPIGPIGMHVKLLKPVWSPILESVLTSALKTFIVFSKADQQRLYKLMQNFQLERCGIWIGNHHTIKNPSEPEPQYDTIMRVLDIDNDVVKTQLIIHQAIDQIILIGNREDGHRSMFSGPRLRNVKICFTPHDSRRDMAHTFKYIGKNSHETSGQKVWNNRPMMSTNVEHQVAMQKGTMEQLRQQKRDLEEVLQRHKKALLEFQQARVRFDRSRNDYKRNVQRAEERVERLQHDFDQVHVEDGQLDALKAMLAEAQQEVDIHEAAYGAQVVDKQDLDKVSTARKREWAAVKVRVETEEMGIKKANVRLNKLKAGRQIAVQEKNIAVDETGSIRQQILHLKELRKAAADQVDEFITGAKGLCPERVPVGEGETTQSLTRQLAELNELIKQYHKKQGGTEDEILQAMTDAKNEFDALRQHFQGSRELLALLKKTLMHRLEMYRKFQRYISSRARMVFNYLLSERAFRGTLKIDHKRKLLDVHVEPDSTLKDAKGRGTKTLSGGEKSFSSICLLLSLWEAMNAPLRCLDEYDVFMDDVNRDVSSKMLIAAARRSVGRQFILITPKSLGGGVKIKPDTTIFKMPDPRARGQRTIDEMMDVE